CNGEKNKDPDIIDSYVHPISFFLLFYSGASRSSLQYSTTLEQQSENSILEKRRERQYFSTALPG
ncbi:MAG: hypothetical protein ACTIMD_04090, partial [Loigolactobacillus coryniformis]